MIPAAKLASVLKAVRTAEEIIEPARTSGRSAADTLEKAPHSERTPPALNPLERTVTVLSAVSVATTKQRVLDAWRLVHNEYVRAKILDAPRPAGVHAPKALLEGAPFVLTRTEGGRVSSTLSVMPGAKLPADNVPSFHGALNGLRASGQKLVEIGMFARDSSAPRSGLGGASLRSDRESGANSMKALFAAALDLAQRDGSTMAVITVHPNHVPYYTKLLGFRVLGAEAAHPTVDGARAVLLGTDLATFRQATGGAALTDKTTMLRAIPNEAERRALMHQVEAAL